MTPGWSREHEKQTAERDINHLKDEIEALEAYLVEVELKLVLTEDQQNKS